ncbi:cobaltochelatase subunit CobT [Luteithermobacter gelatinilyticus]|uniref:cobaltochelatase subunit CobT n=1 Tax=Luteithermobacter gelatinilyticus TaxID=2582913 RepID=UPI001AEFE090|nr:cobaltochelatase subunit CobT [Luteithermobacter gelatinilyticus]
MRKNTTRRIEQYKQALTSTIRAIARDREVEVSFTPTPEPGRGLNLSGGAGRTSSAKQAALPVLSHDLPPEEITRTRALGDLYALKRRYHNTALHYSNSPDSPLAKTVYDALEEARIEALGSRRLRGVAANITALTEQYYQDHRMDVADTLDKAQLGDVLKLLVRERLTHQPPPAVARDAVNALRPLIEEKAAIHLGELQEAIADQDRFSRLARKIIADLDLAEDLNPDEQPEDGDSRKEDQQPQPETENSQDEGSDQAAESRSDMSEGLEGEEDNAATDMAAELAPQTLDDLMNEDAVEQMAEVPWNHLPNNLHQGPLVEYRVFTTEFDEIVTAEDLCDPDELLYLRKSLDQQLSHLQGMVTKLANRLQRMLMAQQMRSWEFDLEEGLLDTARLTRVVTNPLHPLSFKMEHETDFKDTVVTLLIDNSGSMRGRPITIAAMCADILARTLERCGVKVEILGFTTRAWKGGKSRAQWLDAHKPKNPGRLNDLRHIIYKTADTPWRRANVNLGLMLREGLLKENIDGESLLWAHSRLVVRPEERRIMMVISDGAPVDDSTLSANSANYLEDHLRAVIDWIEKKSPVELLAIGIGHDVTRYYQNAITLMDAEQLGGAITEQLATLFDEDKRSRRRVL